MPAESCPVRTSSALGAGLLGWAGLLCITQLEKVYSPPLGVGRALVSHWTGAAIHSPVQQCETQLWSLLLPPSSLGTLGCPLACPGTASWADDP